MHLWEDLGGECPCTAASGPVGTVGWTADRGPLKHSAGGLGGLNGASAAVVGSMLALVALLHASRVCLLGNRASHSPLASHSSHHIFS